MPILRSPYPLPDLRRATQGFAGLAALMVPLLVSCRCPSSAGPVRSGDETASAAQAHRAPGPIQHDADRPGHPVQRPQRPGLYEVRSLLDEATRAELWDEGPVIQFGSSDQFKYTQGRWLGGWGESGVDEYSGYSSFSQKAHISFYEWNGGSRFLRVRARGWPEPTPGLLLKVSLDGRPLGTQPLRPGWQDLTFPLGASLSPGPVDLLLEAQSPAGAAAQVRVAWAWLRRDGTPRPLPHKLDVCVLDEPRRCFLASPTRSLSFYLVIPRDVQLAFDYGAKPRTDFKVLVHSDGSASRALFEATVEGGRWQSALLPLDDLAGRLVRLELVSQGPAGVAGWGEPALVRRGEAPVVPPLPPDKQARNLIHIVADAARQDAFRPFNPSSPIEAPALSALAREGAVFLGAHVNGSFTLPSVSSFLSGRYPLSVLTRTEPVRVSDDVPLLPEILRKHGFTTAAFTANPFVGPPFGLQRGWDLHRSFAVPKDYIPTDRWLPEVLQWLRQVRDEGRRFYLYMHTMDTHDPYHFHSGLTRFPPGDSGKGRFRESFSLFWLIEPPPGLVPTPAERRTIRALYEGEVRFFDHQLDRFVKELKRLGLLENTLLVFSNDHGEELWDHGQAGHDNVFYEEILKSPLVLRFPPAFPPGSRVERRVELVDLMPTLLEVLGLPPQSGLHGVSLRRALHRLPAVTAAVYAEGQKRALLLGDYKLIHGADDKQLFDLLADPGETRDLSESRKVALRACEVRLYMAIALPAKPQRLLPVAPVKPGADPEMSDLVRRQLRSLGYLR